MSTTEMDEDISKVHEEEIEKEYEEMLGTIQNDFDLNKPQILEIGLSNNSEPGTSRSGIHSTGRKSGRRNSKGRKNSRGSSEVASLSDNSQTTNEPTGNSKKDNQPETIPEDASLGGSIVNLTKFTKKTVPNKNVLMESIQKTEEKLKQREQIKISILKISVSKLTKVHRFVKPQPWLKVQYGRLYDWAVDLSDPSCDPTIKPTTSQYDGTHAAWIDLKWSFLLERNQIDRHDLIITVCSKEYIIGRYILPKNDWLEIPGIASTFSPSSSSENGYSTISGEVINGLGTVGVIQLLCERSVIEKNNNSSSPQRDSNSKFSQQQKEKSENIRKHTFTEPSANRSTTDDDCLELSGMLMKSPHQSIMMMIQCKPCDVENYEDMIMEER